MKTIKRFSCLFFLFLTVFNIDLICQIRVFNNNNVGINCNTTPASRFAINASGYSSCQAYIYNPNISVTGTGLFTYTERGSGYTKQIMGHETATAVGGDNYNYGLLALAYNATPISGGRAYGVYAQTGNASSGFNYSIYGYLYGSNYGAAIFGAVNGYGDVALSQQYAGYFRGKVKSENSMYAVSFITESDEKFKSNIRNIEQSDVLTKISQITPVQYNLIQFETTKKSSDTTLVTKHFTESDQLFTKERYGVIAQDLQKIYPDLVYEDGDGNLGVDYIGLIPIMIKVLQVQQKKIDDLEAKIVELTKLATNPVNQ